MIDIQKDAARRPELFLWRGPLAPASVDAWIRDKNLRVPPDLRQFWIETGGGDLFESEELLGPFAARVWERTVDSVTDAHRVSGMPPGYLVFHAGLGISVVRQSDGRYLDLDEGTYRTTSEFSSFGEWYRDSLRTLFAAKYGL